MRSSAAALSPVGAAMSDEPGSQWQVTADAAGRLLWASPTVPGARSPRHGDCRRLRPRDAEVKCWADKAYQGGDSITPGPFRSLHLKLQQRRHNSTHARISCLGEQAMAALKGWCLPRELRCSTNRVSATMKTTPALRHAST